MTSEASSRKRKRPHQDGPIFTLATESTFSAPLPAIALQGAMPIASSLGFEVYEDPKRGASSQMLHADTGKIEWDSFIDSSSQGGHSYMLAVHRKSTGATMLVPVQAHTIMPTIKARRRAEDQERSTLTAEEQRILLGQTFGTKKAQKRIAAQQRNKIDAEAADLVELQPHLLANIEAATATLPTLKRIKEEADAARPVPSFDTAATDPRHIYSVEDVAPQGETKAVPIYGLLQAGSAEERIQMLPYKRSRFVNDRLARLLDDLGEAPPSGKQKKQIRYLYLLSAHMAFRSRTHSKDGPRGRLDGIGVPPAIITGIGDRFSEKSKQGKASVTPLMQKKLDNYLAVLALMCDNFTVDVNLLAEDLQMAARLLYDCFRGLGCKLTIPSAAEYEKLQSQAKATGISVSVEKSARHATLLAPLTFPEARKKRAAAPRR